ncbi:ATP-binding protein [Actinokineospora soli]|uniref:ATP-binding protein n=1 Tax=Actinokineospora soli TaxID=1048753 RepID=A0ABW2TNH0_9PSEU
MGPLRVGRQHDLVVLPAPQPLPLRRDHHTPAGPGRGRTHPPDPRHRHRSRRQPPLRPGLHQPPRHPGPPRRRPTRHHPRQPLPRRRPPSRRRRRPSPRPRHRHRRPRLRRLRSHDQRHPPRHTPVTLRLWTTPTRVVVHVTDSGPGPRDPHAGLIPAARVQGGLGLWLTHQLDIEVGLITTPDGFTIRLRGGELP